MCRNNGTCLDLVNNFECSCIPEYSGKLCQWHYSQTCDGSLRGCVDAHTINCTNNYEGTVNNSDGNGFECSCVEGFIGDRCEAKVLPCKDKMVCGGLERKLKCIEGEHISDYRCECKFGYAGVRCEIDVDLCENSPCQNGGTCQDNGNNYTCNCTAGYTGHNCSTVLCDNPDISITCIRNQTANCADTLSGPMCTCHPGFTGARCESVYNACDSSPCHSMATCQPHGNDYSCTCPDGYSGRQCTICSMRYCNCPVDDCNIKAGNGICDVSNGNLRLKAFLWFVLPCRKTAVQQHVTGMVTSVALCLYQPTYPRLPPKIVGLIVKMLSVEISSSMANVTASVPVQTVYSMEVTVCLKTEHVLSSKRRRCL